MGLVTRVVPASELDSQVVAVLASLAKKSPIGMRIGKQAFDEAAGMPLAEALNFLSGKLAEVASTRDAREGITAFLEKRQPVFTGE
jgi:enoyl-CoA hydratase/carnithine racemase